MESADLGLRVMFGVAVLGAGLVGATTLLAPSAAQRWVFAGSTQVDMYLRILGALWLAIGAVAVFGLFDPIRFAPVLLIQVLYKTAWLLLAAYPALVLGDRSSGLIFMSALFTVWVGALLLVLPFRQLFSGLP